MSIEMDPHKVVLRQHRDGSFTLKGLTLGDLSMISHAVTYAVIAAQAPHSDLPEWWNDVSDWCLAWRTLIEKSEGTLANVVEHELPWVDR